MTNTPPFAPQFSCRRHADHLVIIGAVHAVSRYPTVQHRGIALTAHGGALVWTMSLLGLTTPLLYVLCFTYVLDLPLSNPQLPFSP